jgi:hypothetical protein
VGLSKEAGFEFLHGNGTTASLVRGWNGTPDDSYAFAPVTTL